MEDYGIAALSHAGISDDEWAEPMRSPPVQKNDETLAVVRKRYENSQAVAAADERADFFDGNPPPDDSQDEFATAVERFAGVVERRLADLENENVELKGLLGDAVAKFAKLEGKVDALLQLAGNSKKLWMP